ncbi:MAG: twin-arginine translocase TatA/TatE family subunit [Ardenticatenaceae bacterium]|nr:twin-arginine translocase TatA/TatE family subunit [Anaerolineales bacterium]MCB8920093.1 twin-arginine translocase TatA/TatE family subunit [Ardenticatenaceae bacterium]
MDSVFGIGFPELVVILLLAGLVMGPQRIRQVARWLGLMTAKLQSISRMFTRQLNAELDSMDGAEELRGAMQDVQELRRQVDELRRELLTGGKDVMGVGKTAVTETRQSLQSIMPPDLAAKKNDGPKTAVPTPPLAPTELPNLVEVLDDPES